MVMLKNGGVYVCVSAVNVWLCVVMEMMCMCMYACAFKGCF